MTTGRDTTMTLKEFFDEQEKIQERMGWPGGKNQEGAQKHLHAAMVEVVEALNETNWKVWKPNYLNPISSEQRENLKTELTDIMQFVVNAAICLGYTAEDLSCGLRGKHEINHKRIDVGETTK